MSQLTNYIQKELDKGFSKDLITKKLLQAGYGQEEIDESFTSLKAAEPLLRRKSIEMPHMEIHIKRSRWIFGFLAIVLVAVFGYLIYLYEGELPAFEVSETSPCDGTVEEKNVCLLQLAQQGEDVCDQLSTDVLKTLCTEKYWEKDSCNFAFLISKDTAQREQCLWDQAVATQDASYCYQKLDDQYDCLVALIDEVGDVSICGENVLCYEKYALSKQDEGVCDLLVDESSQTQCHREYRVLLTTVQ